LDAFWLDESHRNAIRISINVTKALLIKIGEAKKEAGLAFGLIDLKCTKRKVFRGITGDPGSE
jgi:hypothetical protein